MKSISVNTNFNVNLSLNADTLLRRVAAYTIDFIILIFYLYVISRILSSLKLNAFDNEDAARLSWGITSLCYLPVMFYTLTWEVLSGGYTPGKFFAKIKVVKLHGFQPTFTDYFIRWIFRSLDIYIFILAIVLINNDAAIAFFFMTGWIAVIVVAVNKKGQRIGDIIAGTTVASTKYSEDIDITILADVEYNYKPVFPEVIKFSDNDMRIIKDTFERAWKSDDFETINKLRNKVETTLDIKSDLFHQVFFETIIKDFNFYTKKD